jgi:hypothetical protein
MEDSNLIATKLQQRIKDKYKVKIPYRIVYDGKGLAHKQLFGSWDNSFNNLYRFKSEVERFNNICSYSSSHNTRSDQI